MPAPAEGPGVDAPELTPLPSTELGAIGEASPLVLPTTEGAALAQGLPNEKDDMPPAAVPELARGLKEKGAGSEGLSAGFGAALKLHEAGTRAGADAFWPLSLALASVPNSNVGSSFAGNANAFFDASFGSVACSALRGASILPNSKTGSSFTGTTIARSRDVEVEADVEEADDASEETGAGAGADAGAPKENGLGAAGSEVESLFGAAAGSVLDVEALKLNGAGAGVAGAAIDVDDEDAKENGAGFSCAGAESVDGLAAGVWAGAKENAGCFGAALSLSFRAPNENGGGFCVALSPDFGANENGDSFGAVLSLSFGALNEKGAGFGAALSFAFGANEKDGSFGVALSLSFGALNENGVGFGAAFSVLIVFGALNANEIGACAAEPPAPGAGFEAPASVSDPGLAGAPNVALSGLGLLGLLAVYAGGMPGLSWEGAENVKGAAGAGAEVLDAPLLEAAGALVDSAPATPLPLSAAGAVKLKGAELDLLMASVRRRASSVSRALRAAVSSVAVAVAVAPFKLAPGASAPLVGRSSSSTLARLPLPFSPLSDTGTGAVRSIISRVLSLRAVLDRVERVGDAAGEGEMIDLRGAIRRGSLDNGLAFWYGLTISGLGGCVAPY